MAYKAGSRRAQDITSGEFANARISSGSVVQHEEELEGVLDLGDLQVTDLSMGDNVITLDQDPASDSQAARKGYVDAEVSAEATARAAAVSAEASARAAAVTAEESARQSADTTLQSNIDAEASARASADTALGARIDDILTNSDPAALDSLSEIVAAFQAEDSNLDNAITTLAANQTSALNTESARAQAAEAAIQADVDQNEADGDTDRAAIRSEFAAADAALQSAINTLQADVDGNESDGDTDRAAIRSEFAAADAALVGDAASGYNTLGKLEDKILEEASARASADTTLQSAIDAVQADVDQNEADADSGLASATSDRAAIRSEMAANETARDASVEAIRAALQADVDQNESDADAGLASATSDRAAIRSEFAAADSGLSSEIGVERGRIDAILAGADVDLDTLVEVVAAYELADTNIIASITSLQADVDQNESDADSAIAALQADVDQNEADADAALASATTDRAAVRSEFAAADAAISASLATETSDRQAADTTLQANIDAVQADVDQNEADGDTDRAAIRSEFATADAAIQADLDSFRDSMTIGEEVQAYDQTLNQIASAYVPGHPSKTKNSIALATCFAGTTSGEADSVAFVEMGDFSSYQVKHGVQQISPSTFGNTTLGWEYSSGSPSATLVKKYNRIATSGIGNDLNGNPVTSVTIELPAIDFEHNGKELVVKCDELVGSVSNAITVNLVPASGSSSLIDGASSFVLDDAFSSITLVSDSTAGWMVF